MLQSAKILRCPCCGEVMIYQELGFWRCPVCDGEFWPPDEDEEDERAILSCWLEDVRRPLPKHGGGRSNKGRRKKKVVGWKPWMVY